MLFSILKERAKNNNKSTRAVEVIKIDIECSSIKTCTHTNIRDMFGEKSLGKTINSRSIFSWLLHEKTKSYTIFQLGNI